MSLLRFVPDFCAALQGLSAEERTTSLRSFMIEVEKHFIPGQGGVHQKTYTADEIASGARGYQEDYYDTDPGMRERWMDDLPMRPKPPEKPEDDYLDIDESLRPMR